MDEMTIRGLAVALGVGMLIGIEREKSKGSGPHRGPAGVRTFTLAALLGALGQIVAATPGLLAALAAITLLAVVAYYRSHSDDPGITTEVALVVTCFLGGLAQHMHILSAGLGVLVALVLAARSRLHTFVQEKLTEREIADGLLLAAAALVVLPVLPDRAVDPYGVLNPRIIWTLVVVVMLINAAGYVALRALGPTAGLAISGFAGGFVSSTATIGAMGSRSKAEPELRRAAAAGAALSSVATVIELAIIIAVTNRQLLAPLWPALAGGGLAALGYGALFSLQAVRAKKPAQAAYGRPFELRAALIFAGAVTLITFASAVLARHYGSTGALMGVAFAGFADTHSAAASAANLAATGILLPNVAALTVLLAMLTNTVTKAIVSWVAGGPQFALWIVPGLVLMIAGAAVGAFVGGLIRL